MSIFRFKQFSVDQTGCSMKVNTDGVLLGALAGGNNVQSILDIGTGTGVIALMLAQRFAYTQIDAVELDETAAQTASSNFQLSAYANRLNLQAQSFQTYFEKYSAKKYDLIVSNPPFYIQSLSSPYVRKSLAKHADNNFFEELILGCAKHLTARGGLWLILPLATSTLVKQLASQSGLYVQQIINIHSYTHSSPHREVLVLAYNQTEIIEQRFIIYDEPKIYNTAYKDLLKDFLTIF